MEKLKRIKSSKLKSKEAIHSLLMKKDLQLDGQDLQETEEDLILIKKEAQLEEQQ